LLLKDLNTNAMNQSKLVQIIQAITQIQRMEPGKLCILRQGPEGPYYNLQYRENGRSVSRYVPRDQIELVAKHTANYQTFLALVDQYAQIIIERTRAERVAGVKKSPHSPAPCAETVESNVDRGF
jgi:hypothetical protein